MKGESNQPDSPIEALDRKVWKTTGARFNASRRLVLNHYWSVAAVAALSVYSVVAGLFLLVEATVDAGSTALSAALIGAAIGILTLSLLESARSYQLRADRHHRCGMQLNELYSEIRYAALQEDGTSVMEMTQQYHLILQSYEDNHAPADYNMFLAQYANDLDVGSLKAAWYRINWYWRSAGPYLMGIATPPLLFLMLN